MSCVCLPDALKKMKYRRHIPTQQELDEQKVQAENKPPEPVNTYPCEVMDCECKRMLQPAGWDAAMPLPKLCRNCKHAEMYHVKVKKGDEKKNKSSKRGGSATSKGKSGAASKAQSAASTARGTTARGTGSASAKKASGKKGSKK